MEPLINSLKKEKASQGNPPEITLAEDMLSTPMEISTMETMWMVSVRARESTCMQMATNTKEISRITRSMELENLLTRKKANTMVRIHLFRSMGKWSKAWRRDLSIPK